MEISSSKIVYLSIKEIPLEMGGKFTLCFTKVELESKNYIADVFLKFKGDIVANNYLETIEFFSFIDGYIKRGHISSHENSFFKVSQKDKVSFLKCKFSQDEYFLSTPKARTMLTVYNKFSNNYTLKHLIQSRTILTEEEAQKTIFSNFIKKEDNVNATIEHIIRKRGVEKYVNYMIFDDDTLELYNIIKYETINYPV